MKKQVKIGLLTFVCLLLISTTALFIMNNHQQENKKIKEDSNIHTQKENQEGETMENKKIKLVINNQELTATLNDNSSSRALIEELKKESITIEMSDYANMEKVGDLGVNLPRNDENITTSAGELILYQGNNFVIYYDTNRWSLTRLGKINNISSQELKSILGKGNVTVQLSLK